MKYFRGAGVPAEWPGAGEALERKARSPPGRPARAWAGARPELIQAGEAADDKDGARDDDAGDDGHEDSGHGHVLDGEVTGGIGNDVGGGAGDQDEGHAGGEGGGHGDAEGVDAEALGEGDHDGDDDGGGDGVAGEADFEERDDQHHQKDLHEGVDAADASQKDHCQPLGGAGFVEHHADGDSADDEQDAAPGDLLFYFAPFDAADFGEEEERGGEDDRHGDGDGDAEPIFEQWGREPEKDGQQKDDQGDLFFAAHFGEFGVLSAEFLFCFFEVLHFRFEEEQDDAPGGQQQEKPGGYSVHHPAGKAEVDPGHLLEKADCQGVGPGAGGGGDAPDNRAPGGGDHQGLAEVALEGGDSFFLENGDAQGHQHGRHGSIGDPHREQSSDH